MSSDLNTCGDRLDRSPNPFLSSARYQNWLMDLEPGSRVYNAEENIHMGDRYTVQPGDSLSRIARRHDYPSWRVIYNHPDNADFRRRRPNPNLIFPGDILILPDRPRSAPDAVLFLPWDFASGLGLPRQLTLEPLSGPNLFSLGPYLFPPTSPLPSVSPGPNASPGGTGVTLGGPVYDSPITLTGEPVHGGYGDALKWSARATLRYPFVRQRLDAAQDWAIDIAWRSAPTWRRGLEIGVGVAGASVLLSLRPSREFILEHVHGQDIPLSLIGIDWLSVQPRLGINGDWGGVITFDLQNILNPRPPHH